MAPDISGSTIVYADWRAQDWRVLDLFDADFPALYADIYAYDLNTRTERRLTSTKDCETPVIDGNLVAYERSGHWSQGDIYVYDLSTRTERQLTSHDHRQTNPSIDGKRVVWEDYRNDPDNVSGESSDIYLRDLTAGTEVRLTDGFGQHRRPVIHGDLVAYEQGSYDESSIRIHDLRDGTDRRVPSTATYQSHPALWGTNLVYVGLNASRRPTGVYLYDVATNVERKLTTGTGWYWRPDISGDTVVYQVESGGNTDVYAHRLATGVTHRVTADPASQSHPAVDGTKVVYEDEIRIEADIYLEDVSALTVRPRPYVGTPVAPALMYAGKARTVYGTLKPRHIANTSPVRLFLWKKVGIDGWWQYRGTTTAKAINYSTYSRYTTSLRLPSKGAWRIRAYHPGSTVLGAA
ncbi:MAG: hypothetical protein Q8T08_13005, partial [Ignavibacteria bacterium]|nr:hypothetical protein [Ignavibacteria bacterium]